MWCVVFLTLFIGSLFYQAGHDQRSLYARIAFIFFLVCMQSLVTLVFAVLTCTWPHSNMPRCVLCCLVAASRCSRGWTGCGYVGQPLTHSLLPVLSLSSVIGPPLIPRPSSRSLSSLSVTEERTLFTRERNLHMYRTTAYFLSKTLVELPVQLGLSFLLGSIGYYMVGLQPSLSHFLRFSLGLGLLALSSNSMGQILGAVAPTPVFAVMLSPLCVIPFMLTSGFFLNQHDNPPWLLPLKALSPHLYVFTALFAVEFDGLQLYCRHDELIPVWLGERQWGFCYLQHGEQVLRTFRVDGGLGSGVGYWLNMLYVACLFVGFRVVALLALKWRERRRDGGGEGGLDVAVWMRRVWLQLRRLCMRCGCGARVSRAHAT